MPERDAQDSTSAAPISGAPPTPRASSELGSGPMASATPMPESNTRAAQPLSEAGVSEPSDTLLSAGKPADRLELLIEDRLAVVDERLRELDARLAVLEQRKSTVAPDARQKPWLWIAFLIALVVVFQLLHRVR